MKGLVTLLFVCYLLFPVTVKAQARLVLNGANITLANGAGVVIENPASDAITRNSGSFILNSDGEFIKWKIGTTTGTYVFPLAHSATEYIPLTFTKTAGVGAGSFLIGTYRTATWQNSTDLPPGVIDVDDASGNDNSEFVIDRFWKIEADGYTTKPDLTNLVFTYLDDEVTAGSNTITEANLKAQRWNSNTNDWGDMPPSGTANAASNTVTTTAAFDNLYKWWTLVDAASPLPIVLTSFTATCENGLPALRWETKTETSNDHFTIEGSNNGRTWDKLKKVIGAGNSNSSIKYAYRFEEDLYSLYRLRQTDFNGQTQVSEPIHINCKAASNFEIALFPNPAATLINYQLPKDLNAEIKVEIKNVLGQTINSKLLKADDRSGFFEVEDLAAGTYFMCFSSTQFCESVKFFINR